MAPALCGNWCEAELELRGYVRQLRRAGRLADAATDTCGIKVDLDVAVAMFTSSLFADAMGRDVMPEMYPQPAERAPVLYTRCFLRAIGCTRAHQRRPGTDRKTSRTTAARKIAAPKLAARGAAARATPTKGAARRTPTRTHT